MSKITLMVGSPGSGKSTIAKLLAVGTSTIRISQHEMGKEQHWLRFENSLQLKRNIIVDRMSFSKEQREKYLAPARALGYQTEIRVLHVPFEICMARCLDRVGHETIKTKEDASRAINFFFSKYERVEDSEADIVIRDYMDDVPKTNAIWVDMDNTLSDASHREHFLSEGKKKNWKGFFDAMGDDPVNQWCKELIKGMSNVARVLIVSARPDDYRKVTESWLLHNFIAYDDLIMRRRGDFRKDSIVKEILYEFEIKPKHNLLFSVDDRKDVIDKMRSHGIMVLDCAGEKGFF